MSVNSPDNRLVRERPYALKAGDVIFIEPYDIDVSIDAGAEHAAFEPLGDLFGEQRSVRAAPGAAGRAARAWCRRPYGGGEVDPLKFFDSVSRPAPAKPPAPPVAVLRGLARRALSAAGRDSRPGRAAAAARRRKSDHGIPVGLQPARGRVGDSADRRRICRRPPSEPPRRPKMKEPPPRLPSSLPRPVIPMPDAAGTGQRAARRRACRRSACPADRPAAAGRRCRPPAPVPPVWPLTPPLGESAAARSRPTCSRAPACPVRPVTPELARNLGEILRVVVAGLMDVLQSRQRIKEEFRMRQTRVPAGRQQSAEVLGQRRGRAAQPAGEAECRLPGPVEAFADAFDDLRDHQLAMLAGMRVAFEAMLAEFDPDRLQEEFDRQLAQGVAAADAGQAALLGPVSREAARDAEGPGSRLRPAVRRGVRPGLRGAVPAARTRGAPQRGRVEGPEPPLTSKIDVATNGDGRSVPSRSVIRCRLCGTRRCLPITASSGPKGCSCSRSTFSSRIATSSGTSRPAARRSFPTAGASPRSSSSAIS